MKMLTANGDVIRARRKELDRIWTQQAFAHEIGISERTLREIERRNARVDAQTARRMAAVLRVDMTEIVFAIDGPKLVPPLASQPPSPPARALRGRQLIPRFNSDNAKACKGEDDLLGIASGSDQVRMEVRVSLNGETARLAEELTALLEDLSWFRRPRFSKLDASVAMSARRRLREIYVLLKGNDIWIYALNHMKSLPESDIVPERTVADAEWHGIFVLAPPQDYGEDSVTVDVDNGYPRIIDWDKPLY